MSSKPTVISILCEVAGGTSIIHKTLQAFLPATVGTVLLVDMHGYDGCPALAALEAGCELGLHQQYTNKKCLWFHGFDIKTIQDILHKHAMNAVVV